MKSPLTVAVLLLIPYLSFSQPVNDACASAINVPVGPVCSPVTGSLYASSPSSTTGTGNCNSKRDVWYKFTVPAASSSVRIAVTLTSSPASITVNNTYIEPLNGNICGSSLSKGCTAISSNRVLGGLTPGTTYLFRIHTTADVNAGGSGTYNFNVCVSANDDCNMATPIVPGTTVDGSTLGASATAGVPVDCASGTPDDDVWYKFTAVHDYATVVANTIGSDLSASGVRMQMLSGSCGSFNSVACGTRTINATGLVPGTDYYVRVYSAGSGQTGSSWGFQLSVFPSARTQITAGRMNEVYDQQIISAPQALLDPWEVIYGPDNQLWISESKGYRIYKINPVTGVRDTILDISQNSTFLPLADRGFNCQFGNGSGAQGGCAGLVLHPKFLDPVSPKNYVYVSYVHTKMNDSIFVNRVVRFDYNTTTGKLESPISLCDTLPGSNDHNSQRMIIAPVGGKDYLFYASGDMGAGQFKNSVRPNKAQLTGSYEGKILRFNLEPDGDGGALDRWIPSTGTGDETNPYNAALGVQSAVWSVGIRNNQGFAYDAVKDKLYGSSHGPFSDDEINVIERAKNYGHPLVIGYADGNVNGTTAGAAPAMNPPHPSSCPLISDELANAAAIGTSYKDPLFSAYPNSPTFPSISNLWDTTKGSNAYWPSEGWSGLDFYQHTAIPGWKRSLLAASLKWGRLVRLKLDASGTKTGPTTSSADTISYFGSTNRFRDLAFSPDGKDIYVVMDRSLSTSGPSAANPIITSCQGCLQKYSFLGYRDAGGKSSIPASIPATDGEANVCNAGTTVTIDNTNNMLWVPITGPDGNILAEIFTNGQNLGTVSSSFYKHVGPIRVAGTAHYLNRSITITPQVQPSGNVKVRLYFSKAEFDSLDTDALSQITTISDIRIYKNNNPCQNAISLPATIVNPEYSEVHGDSSYMVQAEISGFSTFYFAATNTTLPLELLSFTGHYKNASTYLNWKTENELNTVSFVVERSTGNSVYEAIGTVFAKGGPGEKANYNFEDKDASKLGVDKLYYRLRITDKDGSWFYSNIVVVNIGANGVSAVSVFPNPTEKQTTVLISSPAEQTITWKLVDAAGRILQTKQITIRKGENRINLDLHSLKAGVYYLQLNGALINKLEKIQKL
jgi:PQQ-dependent dehydrogenase (s-GDH family)